MEAATEVLIELAGETELVQTELIQTELVQAELVRTELIQTELMAVRYQGSFESYTSFST